MSFNFLDIKVYWQTLTNDRPVWSFVCFWGRIWRKYLARTKYNRM